MGSSDIEGKFQEANNYFFNNDYDTAKELYENIIKKDSKHAGSYEKLGRIELKSNNSSKALDHFELSLKYCNNNANLWNECGNIYLGLKKRQDALRCYKEAIAVDNKFYWAMYNMGLTYTEIAAGDSLKRADALDSYLKAIEVKPDYYPALNEIGVYYLDTGNYNQAEDFFNRTIKANSKYKYPYFNMAKILKEKGDNAQAITFLQRAIDCDPSYTGALNNLGIIYYDQKDYDKSLYYYSKALEADPKYKYALFNAGIVFECKEQYKKAMDIYQKTLEVDPQYDSATKAMNDLKEKYGDVVNQGDPLKPEDINPATYSNSIKSIDTTPLTTITTDGGTNSLFCEKFGRNITKMARDGKLFEVKGRDSEIRAVLEVLYQIKKNNPIIIGKAGVGKTAIVEGLAQKIVKGEVPDYFKKMEIIEINMGMLVAGTNYRGDFEKRLKTIIDEVSARDDIILFIDEIHTVIGAGEVEGGSLNASNMLKPALARGELRCIGATTIDEFNANFSKDAAFERRFYKIMVDELNKDVTLDILKLLTVKMKNHYNVGVNDSTLQLIVDLADSEIKTRSFPDKAIDILEKSFSRCALDGLPKVTDHAVKAIVGEFVGVKFASSDVQSDNPLKDMEKFLKERLYGQDNAIDKICRVIKLTKQKLDLNPDQPDGVFLFAGSTGIGKTYLAKLLSKFLFGNENKLITINMAEFTESHSISKLIGAPPGYVGYSEAPLLTSKIMENPSAVLLLDELEKAHPEILKIFLQVFDEGHIEDARGNYINFSNVTIIMTTNIIQKSTSRIGFDKQSEAGDLKLADYFPPEFVNRIDEVIVFDPITKDVASRILKDIIIKKAKHLFEKRGIVLNFDSIFVDYIIELGFSPTFGVRYLERTFEKEVMSVLANYLFDYPDASKIDISAENGSIKVIV